jgi:hypothetical protein
MSQTAPYDARLVVRGDADGLYNLEPSPVVISLCGITSNAFDMINGRMNHVSAIRILVLGNL